MGLISGINIDGNLIGSALGGIGKLAKDIRQAVTGEINPEKRAEIEAQLLEIENQGLQAQIELNKIEAQNASVLFRAGGQRQVGFVYSDYFTLFFFSLYLHGRLPQNLQR